MPRRAASRLPESVMVVGGAGFIGSHLVDRFLAEGSVVHVVDSLVSGSLANLASARRSGHDGRLTIQQLDGAAPEFADYLARRRPEVVYLLAGLEPAARRPMEAVLALGTFVNVLEAVRVGSPTTKVVFTVPGSILYGDQPARSLPVKEDAEHRPVGVAGVVASSMIDTADTYRREHSVEFTAIVLGTVYGSRLRPDSNVVGAVLASRRDRTPFGIEGDGRQTRDLLHVDDCVDGLFRASTRGGGLVLNVATGIQTAVRDLWAAVGGGDTTQAEPRFGSPSRVALSPSRARLHLGWSPWTSLDDGLARCGDD
ncbi:MAG: UDP-glucose 4-epimerase [Actinomycetota bacterium]